MNLQGCSEWEAFQAVRLWAAGGAEQAEVERLLPLVRFPLMSPQELQVRPIILSMAGLWRLFSGPT